MYQSSDSDRSAAPLPYAQYARFQEPFPLELGGELKELEICYETYGQLNENADNGILVCHALSGDSHVTRHDPQDSPGWWDILVGPGKPVDTDSFFVICPNILGGCRGTTGPNSINPNSGKPYGRGVPRITILDIVRAQELLIDHLGIEKLYSVMGGSMGGQMVLEWALSRPKRILTAVALATSSRLSAQSLAFDIVGRNAILQDPHYDGGHYYDSDFKPNVGLAIARMIGHITYLSPQSMQEKFEEDRDRPRDVSTVFEKDFSVGSYLGYQGDKFVERFDANSYIALSKAMDLFDKGATDEELRRAFQNTECRWMIISFTSDWLFPAEQSQAMVNALIASRKEVSYCNVSSSCGHDAFLLPNDIGKYGELIRGFLSHPEKGSGYPDECAEGGDKRQSTSIFQSDRLDYDRITDLIPPSSDVLDLGCGTGSLLCRLRRRGCLRLLGVELDDQAIVTCVRRGVPVIQADLNQHLAQFPDKSWDYVVLSQTLQAVTDVEGLLREIVRVGGKGIVSFPNFAYAPLREMLYRRGRAPESPGILRYKWYDTPNLRFFSIEDFEELCREIGVAIHRRIALDTERGVEIRENPNLNADLAIYVINGDRDANR